MTTSFASPPVERGTMSVPEFCAWAGISRASFYRMAGSGELQVRKIRNKSVVTLPDAQAWLAALPSAQIAEAA